MTAAQTLRRLVTRLVTLLVAGSVAGIGAVLAAAVPAHADVPVGWNPDPEPVNAVHAVLLLGGVPLALAAVIILAVYVPSLARGERITPGASPMADQWLGGPRKGTAELAGPDSSDSAAGGARGSW